MDQGPVKFHNKQLITNISLMDTDWITGQEKITVFVRLTDKLKHAVTGLGCD